MIHDLDTPITGDPNPLPFNEIRDLGHRIIEAIGRTSEGPPGTFPPELLHSILRACYPPVGGTKRFCKCRERNARLVEMMAISLHLADWHALSGHED